MDYYGRSEDSARTLLNRNPTDHPERACSRSNGQGPAYPLRAHRHLLTVQHPLFSKPQTTNVRYALNDNFLRFWFTFIYKHDNLVQLRQFGLLKQAIDKSYSEFAGFSLERLVRQAFSESGKYSHVGNYWEKAHQNEIDLIAYNEFTQQAVVAEVKLNGSKISLAKLENKAKRIAKHLPGYAIEFRGIGLENLMKELPISQ